LEDLSHVKGCLDALQFCEDYDIAAMRLVDVIAPLYQRLCDAVGQPGAVNSLAEMQPKTDIMEDRKIPMQLGHIIYQSVAAMSLPCQEIWV
jgi:UV DNA damage repair endonuclease